MVHEPTGRHPVDPFRKIHDRTRLAAWSAGGGEVFRQGMDSTDGNHGLSPVVFIRIHPGLKLMVSELTQFVWWLLREVHR